ncbi:hypothetical protein PINS_up007057 [Pythium insidiosum]|nr:hypothetical protein PINS_up007057 [Pythium insidiosum]
MATLAPWAKSTETAATNATSSSTRAPSLQEIMDEALAVQLFEQECATLDTTDLSDVFGDLEIKAAAPLVSDNDCDADVDDYSSDDDDDEHTVSGTSNAASTQRAGRFDRSMPVSDRSAGFNSIRESFRRWEKVERHGGQSVRAEAARFATQDSVLDARTTLLLQKLVNQGELDRVHGCVQSGKEANVYFAEGTDERTMRSRSLAVKVFKTTKGAFANRHEYVTGDRRFDLAFQKKSRRRQIHEWTEKEFRNLCRASRCVRAPTPIAFKDHVVVMTFIGDDGWPAPTLKEAAPSLTRTQLRHAYVDLLLATRRLFQDARLVHGDLSEYNVLYYQQRCWLIDFGQAVDQTHPSLLPLLRRDLQHVREFFVRAGLSAEADRDGDDAEADVVSEELAFQIVTCREQAPEELFAAFPQLLELVRSIQSKP